MSPKATVVLPQSVVVPPPEQDELITSWLARVGRLYGAPILRLLADAGHDPDTLDLTAADLGLDGAPLGGVAALLRLFLDRVARHIIASGYPWAVHLVTRAGAARR